MHSYIVEHRIADQYYYSVYNSRGQMALWTTNRALAEFYSRQFQQNPRTTEITIADRVSVGPKRQ